MAINSQELAAKAAQITTEDWGSKVRIHQLAKQLELRASELLPYIESAGISGKKVQSSLTKQEATDVVRALSLGDDATSDSSTPAAGGEASSEKEQPAKPQQDKKTPAKKRAAKRAVKKTAKKQEEKSEDSPKHKQPKRSSRKKSSESGIAAQEATPQEAAEQMTAEQTPVEQVSAEQNPVEKTPGEATPEELNSEKTQEKPKKASAKKSAAKKATAKEATANKRTAKKAAGVKATDKNSDEVAEEKAEQADTPENSSEQTSTRSRRRVRRVVRRVVGRPAAERRKQEKTAPKQSTPQAKNNEADQGSAAAHATKRAEELHPAERDESDVVDQPVRLKGSTRLASQRQWRRENRERTHTISRSAFLARRESVERKMVVRDSHRSDHQGLTTQVGVVEDGMLVEHFVTSETQQSMVGNIYLGRVQNVLASMEAAFVDIGTGRNAVLYAGEMNWHSPHLHSKNRRIDSALRSGDQILVQVIKDPVGHKGARLSNRVSFAGRYLVYFPGGTTAGISRKLPEPERKRLKDILANVIPGEGGAIIRTAAENVSEEQIGEDVARLHSLWEKVSKEEAKARERKGAKPIALYEEPNMLVKVVRDIFNEDFKELIVDGEKSWQVVRDYVARMAPDLQDRLVKWNPNKHEGEDVFAAMHLDEQLTKALSRKVWLPSGGYLIIDPTEAMTVIDVNTGSFVGAGGNLEETVTQNNLEAAEEIVRQMRLRDLGGMIVVDFIDMVLEDNRDLVLRRLTEYLGRDRTRHKVSEVTSLGLVQMTRKRLGTGLLETFSTVCTECDGRGVIVHADPVEQEFEEVPRRDHGGRKERQQARREKATREHIRQASKGESQRRNGKADTESGAPENGKQSAKSADSKPAVSSDPKRSQGEETTSATTRRVRRRRVVRSVTESHGEPHGDSGSRAFDESLSRRSKNYRKRNTEGDSIAEIAASALHHAKVEDPDEPSGADYMPNDAEDSQSVDKARRAGRNRDKEAGSQHDRDNATASGGRPGSPSRRRRARRVVRARAMRAGNDLSGHDDPQARPESPSEQQLAGGQVRREEVRPSAQAESYAQAKEEFDASPRRKRQTRGNSRSDVPPRPEDFNENNAPDESTKSGEKHSDSSRGERRSTRRKRSVRSSHRGRGNSGSRDKAENDAPQHKAESADVPARAANNRRPSRNTERESGGARRSRRVVRKRS